MMFSRIRKRLTYANVAMTLALVFAMTGGAYAASKYVITSTKQISPKVLKALKGSSGTNGAAGLAGPVGPAGAAGAAGAKGETGAAGTPGAKGENGAPGVIGAEGSPWTAGGTLPSGKTETGVWGFDSQTEALVIERFSFPIPLKALPEAIHLIKPGEEGKEEAAACPGTLAEPKAAPGVLCVYSETLVAPDLHNHTLLTTGVLAAFLVTKEEAEHFLGAIDKGTWAVTAP